MKKFINKEFQILKHMNLSELQEKIKDFCKKYDLENPPEHRVLDFTSEVGEISKEILKMTSYGKKKLEYRDEIKAELGDALYSLITIANYFNIDLEEALNMVLEKYKKRLAKGSADSEND
jgi:NTP pyrophosphatase (non-canonical NTP hydrolase)